MRTRDALDPLLAALGLVAAERDGKVALIGGTAAHTHLMVEDLALPEEGSGVRADRTLEPSPGTARVRFIEGDADYQTGSVVVRSTGEGGGVDLDLPAVCSAALARAAAERALDGAAEERLTVALGPLQTMRLEPGDTVSLDGRDGAWRVTRLDMDDAPSAVLERVSSVVVGVETGGPSAGESPVAMAAPFFRMVELPPLAGDEADGRPLAVVAAEPWRPMAVFAGATVQTLTARAAATRSATVGILTEALEAGPRHRWDGVNTLTVRIEGQAPESRPEIAVLGGANALAVETAAGWELVQFLTAELVGEGVWRLGGLLRGQQGTEVAMVAGAPAGAVVILLDAAAARAESPPAERGLPLIWRAGPAGGPPGGPAVSEVAYATTGLHDRPWSPVHLRVKARGDGGFDLGWIARSRIDGDRWDGPPTPTGPMRFRIRVLAGPSELRTFEAEGPAALYAAADAAADFPGGPGSTAAVAVAQWGEGYGWGVEATAALE